MSGRLRIHPDDNVAVETNPAAARFGHKFALRDIPKGGAVIKYGHPIGFAAADIPQGGHVHTHNLKTGLTGQRAYAYEPRLPEPVSREPGTFWGFRRSDGRTGIRNELWILPTVGCVNGIAQTVARRAQALPRGGAEGVYAFPHPYGCSQLGEDHENTKKALCGFIRHPNAGGVLVLGLGCENNGADGLRAMLGAYDERRVKFLVCQDCEDEVDAALELARQLLAEMEADVREPVSSAELVVGLKCGGSDGLSGVTANPLVGAFSDRLTAEGGAAILTEVPEMFGAETILMARCASEAVFDKTAAMVNGFKAYFEAHGQPVYENPSPGNKDGGITTLEEKSLGCTQKAGRAAVRDVLGYGEPLTARGLNLLDAPGNDLVASTALAASGAQLVLFTTGRGTPFGTPVPTVKISSNTPLYDRKRGWIDFDAGALLSGGTPETMAEELYRYVLRVASGAERTKSEQAGLRDMAIFKSGVTL
jgi:altronate hydrolase